MTNGGGEIATTGLSLKERSTLLRAAKHSLEITTLKGIIVWTAEVENVRVYLSKHE